MLSANQTYFDWFSISTEFEIDLQALRSNYLELQKELHPDKSAGQAHVDQSQVVRLNTQLNDAYDKLKDPVKRAIYLLELAGVDYDPDRQTQDDPQYLMQQLELREQLGDLTASSADLDQALNSFRAKALDQLEQHSGNFNEALKRADWTAAGTAIGRMMFADKLVRDVNEREEELFDL